MLDWTDQQKAIKSNLNTVIGVFGGMAVLSFMGYVVYVLLKRGYSGLVAQVISGAIIVLVLASGLRVLRVAGDRLWSRIEL
jgi:high-affinity Fe2+/Pb2+ permease